MFVWHMNRVVIEKLSSRRGSFDPRLFPVLAQLMGKSAEDQKAMLRAALNPDDLRAQQTAYHLPPLLS